MGRINNSVGKVVSEQIIFVLISSEYVKIKERWLFFLIFFIYQKLICFKLSVLPLYYRIFFLCVIISKIQNNGIPARILPTKRHYSNKFKYHSMLHCVLSHSRSMEKYNFWMCDIFPDGQMKCSIVGQNSANKNTVHMNYLI